MAQAESRAPGQRYLPLPTLQNLSLDATYHDSLSTDLPESQKCTRNSLWSIAHSRSLLLGAAPRFQKRTSAAPAPPAGLPQPLRWICLVTLDQVLSCRDEAGSCISEWHPLFRAGGRSLLHLQHTSLTVLALFW